MLPSVFLNSSLANVDSTMDASLSERNVSTKYPSGSKHVSRNVLHSDQESECQLPLKLSTSPHPLLPRHPSRDLQQEALLPRAKRPANVQQIIKWTGTLRIWFVNFASFQTTRAKTSPDPSPGPKFNVDVYVYVFTPCDRAGWFDQTLLLPDARHCAVARDVTR